VSSVLISPVSYISHATARPIYVQGMPLATMFYSFRRKRYIGL